MLAPLERAMAQVAALSSRATRPDRMVVAAQDSPPREEMVEARRKTVGVVMVADGRRIHPSLQCSSEVPVQCGSAGCPRRRPVVVVVQRP